MARCFVAAPFTGLIILFVYPPYSSGFVTLTNSSVVGEGARPEPRLLRFLRKGSFQTMGHSTDTSLFKGRKLKSDVKSRAGHKHKSTKNIPLCQPVLPQSKVLTFTAGRYERCAIITHPVVEHVTDPMPIMFWFHAAGGQANKPQCTHWSQLGLQKKFTVICAEALQGVFRGRGGFWSLPEVVTDDSGNRCNYNRSSTAVEPGDIDLQYIMAILHELKQQHTTYDISKLFFAGCSMGSHFSLYASTCIKEEYPSSVSAFATHSSGLKVRGDGLEFPYDVYNPAYRWGECPGCQYAPIKPRKFDDPLGLKACVFDNTGDSSDFYWSSVNLAEEWSRLGNKVELHALSPGVHCEIKDYEEIWQCLDDGTGRLQGVDATRELQKEPKVLVKTRLGHKSKSRTLQVSTALPRYPLVQNRDGRRRRKQHVANMLRAWRCRKLNRRRAMHVQGMESPSSRHSLELL